MNRPATSELQERFGLQVDPFAADALPDFFFVGGQRRFLAQRVVHALYFSDGVVLLTGERGAGKTRVIDAVSAELSELTDRCRIEANVMMDGAEIRRSLAACLGLAATAAQDSATLSAAVAHWQPAEREPQPIAVLIDDAQLLAVPVLSECLALVRNTAGRLRLLLAGEPDLMVAWEQIGGSAEYIELPPLDHQESADYVLTRLQAAGYRAEAPLSEQQLRALYQQSRGNIAAINEWMSVFAADTATANSRDRDFPSTIRVLKNLPRRHVGLGVGLLAIVATLILFRGNDKSEPPIAAAKRSRVSRVEQRSVPLTLPLAAASLAKDVLPPHSDAIAVAPSEKTPAPQPQSQSQIQPGAPPTVAAPVTPSVIVLAKPIASNSTPLKPLAVPAEKQQAAAEVVGRQLTEDERELLTWRADQFALQLLGAESQSTVAKFIAERANGVKLYSYRTRHQERPWNIVVVGPYADRSTALATIATLPPALSAQKPWPRTVTSIQTEIRAQR